ncbi:hypothetical protein DRO41_00410 [Candidatus Bathyarchaeota archaeon]|nr:MAG: hypothetical protein DRO41_00410 [Candidatus Bathyarchaeota archaeon]
MSKVPISCKGGKVSDFFKDIFLFHSRDKCKIWDCTCGRRYLWSSFTKDEIKHVLFSDIRDFGDNVVMDLFDMKDKKDLIIFDPPYLFGIKAKNDPREKDYGSYCGSYENLQRMMRMSREKFNEILESEGKIILKCSDLYLKKQNKFYCLHYEWIKTYEKYFEVVDFFVYTGHRFSPTAFQVKNRSCSVNQHSYFIVFQKRGAGDGSVYEKL